MPLQCSVIASASITLTSTYLINSNNSNENNNNNSGCDVCVGSFAAVTWIIT